MADLRLPDTSLFYNEVGQGIPCLVMHGGLGLDHTYLHPGLDPLGDTLRLVYYDHRGHGRSGRPPMQTVTFEQLADDADRLRAHLGFERIAVLGFTVQQAEQLNTGLSRSTLSVFEESGHFPYVEEPDRFVAAVRSVLGHGQDLFTF